jgi:ABC-type sugar transport system permease subunit
MIRPPETLARKEAKKRRRVGKGFIPFRVPHARSFKMGGFKMGGFKIGSEGKENIAGYLFLLPWFAGLILLTVGPMLSSFYLSFTKFDLLSPPQWIGVQNYLDMLQDPRWLSAVKVTLIYVFFSVPLKMVFALLLAMLLNRGLRGLGIYRAIYYVPSLLGGSVAIAILWRQIFDTNGVVNQVLGWVGIHSTTSWISSPNYALDSSKSLQNIMKRRPLMVRGS